MLEEKLNTVATDVSTLIDDAQALFQSAAATSGDKAEDLRHRGMRLLDTAMTHSREAQESATANVKEAIRSANAYVAKNPWRAVAVAGGLGLLAGFAFRSR